jgi:FMN phosphatase YigB (HAD superfamily)
MDGTLLPMDNDVFMKGYFKALCEKLAHYGIEPQALIDAVWTGTRSMVLNDGSRTNEKAFWEKFEQITGLPTEQINEECKDFYVHEFHRVKACTGENPLATVAVSVAGTKAEKVVLATNPLFPLAGQKTRMSWVGLSPEDFCMVTSYETDSYCKPNPKYFLSVCERIGVEPEECLLIGNDEYEDMYAGSLAGLDCYLVTDCMIADEKHPWEGAKGTFVEMLEMLRNLP